MVQALRIKYVGATARADKNVCATLFVFIYLMSACFITSGFARRPVRDGVPEVTVRCTLAHYGRSLCCLPLSVKHSGYVGRSLWLGECNDVRALAGRFNPTIYLLLDLFRLKYLPYLVPNCPALKLVV